MIYFDNVKITNDKKLVGIVKSDNDQIQVGDVIITTQDYYGKENNFQYTVTSDEKTEVTGGYSFEVDMTIVKMIKTVPNPNYTEGSSVPTTITEQKEFNLDKDLIILTAEPAVPNEEETVAYEVVDCCHKKPATAMAYYKYCLFNKALGYLKAFCDGCTVNKDFIDFILKHNALDLAISCDRVDVVIKLWNWFYNKNVRTVITKNCGCHG